MKTLLMTCLAMGFVFTAASTAAANTRETFDRILTSAESIRRDAQDVHQMLRDKKADLAAVAQRVTAIESQAQALNDALASVDRTDSSLTPAQVAAVDGARTIAMNLSALLKAKTALLNDAPRAAKERNLLRAKADGVAKRAAMLERHVAPLRG